MNGSEVPLKPGECTHVSFVALSALKEGFEVFVVADTCGGLTLTSHETALRRLEQAGARADNRINCPCAGSEFLTTSIGWLTSSTYRTCQVSVPHGCTESAEDPI
jgi:hypothetical protein